MCFCLHMCKTTTTTTICFSVCNYFQHWIRSRLALLIFLFVCFLYAQHRQRNEKILIDVLTVRPTVHIFCPAEFLFCLLTFFLNSKLSQWRRICLYLCIIFFFFVFYDVGYTQKIKKDERDFISFSFAGYIYTCFALLASSTHKRSLGLCLFFVSLYRHRPQF